MLTYSQVKECINELGRRELENILNDSSKGEDFLDAVFACDISLSDIDECYQGYYRDDEEFAREMAESLGEVPKETTWPHYCIDWEWAAKELMMDYSEHNGYYFRNI